MKILRNRRVSRTGAVQRLARQGQRGRTLRPPGRVDDPVVAQIRASFSGWHSAYYQPGWRLGQAAGREPAVFSISGWADDLFPPVESFRMYNYLKSLDPRRPVAVAVGDASTGAVRVSLYGNHWAFRQGDRIRLDVVQVDQATYRAPEAAVTRTLQLSGIQLALPVRENTHATMP